MRFCTLSSGSSGNCILVQENGTKLLIDVGIGIRTINSKLAELGTAFSDITAVLVTHEHTDHVKALPSIARSKSVTIVGSRATMTAVVHKYGDIMPDRLSAFSEEHPHKIGDITVQPFCLPHDSADCRGYMLTGCDGRKLCVATDMGCPTESAQEYLDQADFAVIESNYDENMLKSCAYPYILKRRILSDCGHLKNEDCAEMIVRAAKKNCRHFVLFHISENSNTPKAALASAVSALESAGFKPGGATVDFAPRYGNSRVFEV